MVITDYTYHPSIYTTLLTLIHNNRTSTHNNAASPNNNIPDEVDIFKLMNISAKDQGVSLVEGPIAKYPAYKFRLPYGNVPLPNSTVVTTSMNNPAGFTVVFLFRQQKNNLGTLMSVNSPGRLTPWFQLSSNSRTGLLTLKYRVQGSPKLRQIDWFLARHHRKSPLAGMYVRAYQRIETAAD